MVVPLVELLEEEKLLHIHFHGKLHLSGEAKIHLFVAELLLAIDMFWLPLIAQQEGQVMM